jgi:hypothetical protein
MVRWLSKLRPETVVIVQAVVRKPVKELVSVDIKDAELELIQVRSATLFHSFPFVNSRTDS